ncbi:MAG: hypothetical protein QOK05_1034 [Chloroflexota bacterium]|jgi:hypothetical protein|nr:hypothetical protein [Chloroflexota bacterium]
MGVAVHAALARWQRSVDAGGPRRAADLLAAVRWQAAAAHLDGEAADRATARLEGGLRAYAEGPWPRLATLFIEQSVRHTLVGADGSAVELHLRVDRVVRHRRAITILDFKTVTPHAFEMRADTWQLRTYALAAPELLGVASSDVGLVIVDLGAAKDVDVAADPASLRAASAELLACAHGITVGEFTVGQGHPDRPCWSCGFRLACPASLAPDPPRPGP